MKIDFFKNLNSYKYFQSLCEILNWDDSYILKIGYSNLILRICITYNEKNYISVKIKSDRG